MHGDVAARDRGAARAAVGLQDVAVDPHGALAQRLEVDDAAQGAADQALDLDRAPVGAAAARVALLALPVEAGSIPYSAVTQPEPWPCIQRGTLSSIDGRADDARLPEAEQDRAVGRLDEVGDELERRRRSDGSRPIVAHRAGAGLLTRPRGAARVPGRRPASHLAQRQLEEPVPDLARTRGIARAGEAVVAPPVVGPREALPARASRRPRRRAPRPPTRASPAGRARAGASAGSAGSACSRGSPCRHSLRAEAAHSSRTGLRAPRPRERRLDAVGQPGARRPGAPRCRRRGRGWPRRSGRCAPWLGRQDADAAGARGLHGGWASGVTTPITGSEKSAAAPAGPRPWPCCRPRRPASRPAPRAMPSAPRRRRAARPASARRRESGRCRPRTGSPRAAAYQALVQHGEPADAGVEDANRPNVVHGRASYGPGTRGPVDYIRVPSSSDAGHSFGPPAWRASPSSWQPRSAPPRPRRRPSASAG